MKTRLIICALVLIIGFTGCTSSYYVTSPGSPGRHHGYDRDYNRGYNRDYNYHDRYRDNYYDRYRDNRRGYWRYNDAPGNWRYRR